MSSSQNTPEPLDPKFQLKLPTFEGPLDLLLHLCSKHELDIVNLPVAFVTERYLDYIRLMERLDLDIASEYLVMAATLAHIKSKMLLPQEPEDQADEGEEGEEIDPRQELIRRLLEYQKYKAAAEDLGARGVAGRDVFLRGMEAPEATGPAPLAGIGLFKLLDAFQAVLKRAKADLAFQITAEGVTIQDRMTQLTDTLRMKRRCTFDELFADAKSIYDIVVTFLAILEMAKRRLASVYQTEPVAPIHLEYRVLDAEAEGTPAADGGTEPDGAAEADATSETVADAVAETVAEVVAEAVADAETIAVAETVAESIAESVADTVAETVAEADIGAEAKPVAEPGAEGAAEVPSEPLAESIDEEIASEPGVAIESELAPEDNTPALESELAPEVHQALEAPLDPAEGEAQDSRPAEPQRGDES